jgi:hypothetical protein
MLDIKLLELSSGILLNAESKLSETSNLMVG